jgi:hypothetical protein
VSWTPPNECSRCRAEVIWAWTEQGKRMPLDPVRYDRDDDTATAAVYTDHLRRVRVRILRADRPLEGYEHRGMPHVATCRVEIAERAAKAASRASHPSSHARRPVPPAPVDEFTTRRRLRSRTGTPR